LRSFYFACLPGLRLHRRPSVSRYLRLTRGLLATTRLFHRRRRLSPQHRKPPQPHRISKGRSLIGSPLKIVDWTPGLKPSVAVANCRTRAKGYEMTGSRPAGRPWTRGEEDQLRVMLAAGMKSPAIALKLRRTVSAVRTRKTVLNKRESGLKAKGK
jgi:hypothetical protein